MSRGYEGDGEPEARALLRSGESVLLIDRKQRQYLRSLRPGKRIHLRNGVLLADDLIGEPEGRTVRNSGGEPYLVLRPTYASLIPNLPRRAQVIYPKDVGLILLWGDVHPGARVLEVGTGPGALTLALLRAVGPHGEVYSYEIRPDFCDMVRENVERFFGTPDNWHLRLADGREGFAETNLDRMVIDLAEPWTLLPQAAAALRPGAVLVAYVPTVVQVKTFVDHARVSGFGAVEVMENLLRFWHVQGLSIRPEHRMVAHTGFVIVCRHLVGPDIAAPGDEVEVDDAAEDEVGNDDDERGD